jgi:hypothetical protein
MGLNFNNVQITKQRADSATDSPAPSRATAAKHISWSQSKYVTDALSIFLASAITTGTHVPPRAPFLMVSGGDGLSLAH